MAGHRHDSQGVQPLLSFAPEVAAKAILADKGFTGDKIADLCRARGLIPVVPPKDNARNKPQYFPATLYKARKRVEHFFLKLHRFSRIILRRETTITNYLSMIHIAASIIILNTCS
jgi:transposase